MKLTQKYLKFLLLPIILIAALSPHLAGADCSSIHLTETLKRLLRENQGEQALRVLQKTAKNSLEKYFPETEPIELRGGKTETTTKFTSENMKAFSNDVDALLAAKTNTVGFPILKFREWLNEKHDGTIPLPDPFVMKQLLIKNGVTLGDFTDDLINSFLQDTVKDYPAPLYARLTSRFKEAFDFKKDPIHARAWRITKRLGTGLGAFTVMTIVLQLQAPITGYVSTPLGPVNDYMNRLGNRHLAWAASLINSGLNKMDNPDVDEVKGKIKDTKAAEDELKKTIDKFGKYKFKGMTPQESKQVWDAFETRFFDLTQRMGKVLNTDESTGRDSYLYKRLMQPEAFAESLTLIRTNIEVTNQGVEKLNENVRRNADHQPTPAQTAKLKEYNNILELDKRQMAVILSEWMLNRFFYPETVNADELKNSGAAESTLAYKNIDQYLGFPEFAAQLKDEIGIALSAVDFQLNKLERSIQPVTPTGSQNAPPMQKSSGSDSPPN